MTASTTVRIRIGEVIVTRIEESVFRFPIEHLIPRATGPDLERERSFIHPTYASATGHADLAISALVVETEGKRILVDTCIGPEHPHGNPTSTFLHDLTSAGFEPDSIDAVVCTHAHFDHVGWNTVVVDGIRRPTFKNATYLLSRDEHEHLHDPDEKTDPDVFDHVAASLDPLLKMDACRTFDGKLPLGSEICLVPTPGHSPGHISMFIESCGEHGVITGDVVHHPIQILRPEWNSAPDWSISMATTTRVNFIDRVCGQPTTIIGSHFAGAWFGTINQVQGRPGFIPDPVFLTGTSIR
jgi:glyoxylase-like metal-dependent hydrolase (beta-lactamase superfamily II)